MNRNEWHPNPKAHNNLPKDEYYRLTDAVQDIANCIFIRPLGGMTINGVDYPDLVYLKSPEEIREALKVLNSYFLE